MFFKIFIKKKSLLVVTIIILSSIFTISAFLFKEIYLLNNNSQSIETFASTNQGENFFVDLNGDGKKDSIYISSSNSSNQYIISCTVNNQNYSLEVKSPLNTLGAFNKYWPITISFIDISRDKIPELIIQSSENDIAITHIFKWTGDGFKDLYCSTNEIFGVIDSNNNKSPKFFSFSINNSDGTIQKYMLTNNNIKNISYEKIEIPAYNSIISFIDIVTLPYNLYNLPDIFSDKIPYNLIHKLDALNKGNFYYVFQDGFFKDINWDSKGNISEVNWRVRFKKCSKSNKNDIELLEWDLKLKNINNKFIITDM